MNKLKMILAGAVVALGVFGASAGVANAQSANTPECTIDPIPLNMWQKSFTVANGKVTAKFTLKGDANCKKAMTLAVWKAPSANGQPINDQVFHGYKTGTFGKGTHTLTTDLPNAGKCYFQADLLKGSNPKAPDGTANYAYQNGQILTNHPLVDFKFGGKEKCEDKEIPETCPYNSAMKKDDPNCFEPCPYNPAMRKDDKENCKPPVTPTPTTPTPTEVKSLPSTGAGSILAGTMGLSTSAGLAVNYLRSRKQLK